MALFFLSIIYILYRIISETLETEIPAENWNNKDLIYKDTMDVNVSPEQFMKNLENGKYK